MYIHWQINITNIIVMELYDRYLCFTLRKQNIVYCLSSCKIVNVS